MLIKANSVPRGIRTEKEFEPSTNRFEVDTYAVYLPNGLSTTPSAYAFTNLRATRPT